MRLHVSTLVLAIVAACGETLPVAPESPDAAVDAGMDSEPDVGVDVDVVDAGCTTAPCNVVELVTASPRAIAASPDGLIWLVADEVFTTDPSGAPIALMGPNAGGSATGFLAMHATTALMTQGSGVNRCNKTTPCPQAGGGPQSPIFGLTEAGPVAADASEMFVADRAGTRRLATCGLALGCADTPAVVTYLHDIATRMTLTSSFVVIAFADKTLRAYARSDRLEAGAPPAAQLAFVGDLRGLAGAGLDVYWTDGLAGVVKRCRINDCASTTKTVLENRANPRAIAVSGSQAYWVETDGDAVFRCALPDCSNATAIARVARPIDLALGDRVYVTTESAQRIYATGL